MTGSCSDVGRRVTNQVCRSETIGWLGNAGLLFAAELVHAIGTAELATVNFRIPGGTSLSCDGATLGECSAAAGLDADLPRAAGRLAAHDQFGAGLRRASTSSGPGALTSCSAAGRGRRRRGRRRRNRRRRGRSRGAFVAQGPRTRSLVPRGDARGGRAGRARPTFTTGSVHRVVERTRDTAERQRGQEATENNHVGSIEATAELRQPARQSSRFTEAASTRWESHCPYGEPPGTTSPVDAVRVLPCRRCCAPMRTEVRDGVELDLCSDCGVTWFDQGELDTVVRTYRATSRASLGPTSSRPRGLSAAPSVPRTQALPRRFRRPQNP